MGNTIRLKISDPSFTTIEPEKRNHHDKKKKKKEESQVMRSRERKKLQDAVSANSFDEFVLPLKKNNIPPTTPKNKR